MADSNIGSLPQAENLDDDSLLVAEQQGQAVKVTGAQFKEFGRQAVISQVQGYVDQAEAAANRAADAVSTVTDMTVEAATLPSGQSATVAKTVKKGKVNLAFGLPRGEQGIPGPAGPEGPRGPKGETGHGLDIAGRYDTTADVPNPQDGKSYYIGTQAPYDLYTYINGEWVNNGPLSGGGGGVIPEDVVTAEGGAEMSFSAAFGDGPHTITFFDEEEPPLTANDIIYGNETVQDAIDGLKSSVSNGKALIASAITDKGVATAQDATFSQMAKNIGEISAGSDTSDATATSFDILSPKTAYTAAGKVEGLIPTLLGQSITPGTADKLIAGGQYLGGDQIIKGDPNLTSANIKRGVTLFGVDGSLESTFQATLTVTADTGAVVTVTHTDGTEISALSQTGTVVFEIPKEGTWKVTAVRGAAQYNTVTVNVTSQYSAALTAEVHIEYFLTGSPLSESRKNLAATSVGDYAIFGGGSYGNNRSNSVDAYNHELTHTKHGQGLSESRGYLAASTTGNYALFAGGNHAESSGKIAYSRAIDAFDSNLTRTIPFALSVTRSSLSAATAGNYAVFAGGYTGSYSAVVDAYDASLTRTTPSPLVQARGYLAASFNGNYAFFGGGHAGEGLSAVVDAYDASLTRTIPTALSVARYHLSAAAAGNYALFGGGYVSTHDAMNPSVVVDAYDLFLTKSTPERLKSGKAAIAATTLKGYGIFSGGFYSNDIADIYDNFLVHTSTNSLSVARENLAAATTGDYALFGGGYLDNTQLSSSSIVDVYRHV